MSESSSLFLGSDYVRRRFQGANPGISVIAPDFINETMFEQAFINAFQAYNMSAKDYGSRVIDLSQRFIPVPATMIFP